ncbi:MAG: serine acetyltransferase, partial [Clostridiales bacterium]|nr:serine acetyltransferase [Clostridiales bacterium]
YKNEDGASKEEISRRAEQVCTYFFGRISYIQQMLLKDIQAGFDGDPAAKSKEEIIFSYPGFSAILVYRIAHELYLKNVPLIPRIMTEYAHGLTGIDINPGASIGEYFFIDHGTGVVIGETTQIGNNVKLYQGVTLGALSTRSGQLLSGVKRHPTIENNVTVYSGATILGGETVIGEESIIGGNAFITESIPKYTKVSVKNPELTIKAPKKPTAEPEWELV